MAHIDYMGPGALTRVFSSCRHPARGSYKYATSAQCAIIGADDVKENCSATDSYGSKNSEDDDDDGSSGDDGSFT